MQSERQMQELEQERQGIQTETDIYQQKQIISFSNAKRKMSNFFTSPFAPYTDENTAMADIYRAPVETNAGTITD